MSDVKCDHRAIVAHHSFDIKALNKTRRTCTFRKHTSAQHARFLEDVSLSEYISTSGHDDPQEVFDRIYSMMYELLDTYYPERSVTITSSDPPYITPSIKCMLRRKNKLMRSGRVEKAAALAEKNR